MSYTKRTCYKCGWKDIQPNMKSTTILVNSGSSNTGISKRTWFSWLMGSEKAKKQVGNWLFTPSKRTYKRKKTVWVCKNCR